jgi:hypothetical protein
VVGGGERSRGDPVEGLDQVFVAAAGAVADDLRPGQGGRRKGAVLRVGGVAGEADGVAHRPGEAGRGRVDHRCGGGVAGADGDGDRGAHRGGPASIGDLELDHIGPRGGVGEARVGGGRVVVGAVAVQVPGVADRVAVGVGGAAAVELHGEGRRAAGRVGGGHGVGRVVGAEVPQAADLPAFEVGVEQIAAGRVGRQVHGMGVGVDHERLDVVGIGQAVAAGQHRPDAVAGVVAEERAPL